MLLLLCLGLLSPHPHPRSSSLPFVPVSTGAPCIDGARLNVDGGTTSLALRVSRGLSWPARAAQRDVGRSGLAASVGDGSGLVGRRRASPGPVCCGTATGGPTGHRRWPYGTCWWLSAVGGQSRASPKRGVGHGADGRWPIRGRAPVARAYEVDGGAGGCSLAEAGSFAGWQGLTRLPESKKARSGVRRPVLGRPLAEAVRAEVGDVERRLGGAGAERAPLIGERPHCLLRRVCLTRVSDSCSAA